MLQSIVVKICTVVVHLAETCFFLGSVVLALRGSRGWLERGKGGDLPMNVLIHALVQYVAAAPEAKGLGNTGPEGSGWRP